MRDDAHDKTPKSPEGAVGLGGRSLVQVVRLDGDGLLFPVVSFVCVHVCVCVYVCVCMCTYSPITTNKYYAIVTGSFEDATVSGFHIGLELRGAGGKGLIDAFSFIFCLTLHMPQPCLKSNLM